MTARHADALLDLLTDVAMTPGKAEPDIQVRILAWAGHAPGALTNAWQVFRDAVRTREAMFTGLRDWTDIDPEAAGLEDAAQRASVQVGETYRLLAWGPYGASR